MMMFRQRSNQVLAPLFLVAACGGSDGSHGSESDGGACIAPTCLVNLAENCLVSGACVFPAGEEANAMSNCYANGVSQSWVTTTTGNSTTVEYVVRKSGSVCYSMESVQSGYTSAGIVKDANGVVVATLTWDAAGQSPTVTCGDQPPLVGSVCVSIFPGPGADAPCTSGVCSP